MFCVEYEHRYFIRTEQFCLLNQNQFFFVNETFLSISFENLSSAASSAIWNSKWEDLLVPMMILKHCLFTKLLPLTEKPSFGPQICRWLIWLKTRSQIGDERRSWVNLFFCISAARSPPLCCHISLCLTKWSLKMTAAGDWKRWIWIKSGV